jgi:hypothetical protein
MPDGERTSVTHGTQAYRVPQRVGRMKQAIPQGAVQSGLDPKVPKITIEISYLLLL